MPTTAIKGNYRNEAFYIHTIMERKCTTDGTRRKRLRSTRKGFGDSIKETKGEVYGADWI